jgi:hypothetical protein
MLWKLLQISIFTAVLMSNVHYQWTPNGYVAGVVAFFCAFGTTVLLGDLFRFIGWCRKQLLRLVNVNPLQSGSVLRQKSPRQGDAAGRHVRRLRH